MEHKIENAIDHALDSASSQLHIFSVGLGIILAIVGIILFFTGKRTKGKSSKANLGLLCSLIGIVAIVSGIVQM
jgi:uncharacterized membrane protein HdeD (DUF308 family)